MYCLKVREDCEKNDFSVILYSLTKRKNALDQFDFITLTPTDT